MRTAEAVWLRMNFETVPTSICVDGEISFFLSTAGTFASTSVVAEDLA